VRRYERERPGELVHVDVKKLGNIPDGGGWRVTGKGAGQRNRRAADPRRNPNLGYGYLHTALDDYSRLAYTEILADERKDTAAAFLARAHAWYTARGIAIERVLSDIQRRLLPLPRLGRGLRRSGYHPQAHPALPAPDQRQGRKIPPHPGRRMGLRPPPTSQKPTGAPPLTPDSNNHHRGHTALKGLPPSSRVTNLTGQNS
jgi:Integrase core domain